jgi:hypothetical protein
MIIMTMHTIAMRILLVMFLTFLPLVSSPVQVPAPALADAIPPEGGGPPGKGQKREPDLSSYNKVLKALIHYNADLDCFQVCPAHNPS